MWVWIVNFLRLFHRPSLPLKSAEREFRNERPISLPLSSAMQGTLTYERCSFYGASQIAHSRWCGLTVLLIATSENVESPGSPAMEYVVWIVNGEYSPRCIHIPNKSYKTELPPLPGQNALAGARYSTSALAPPQYKMIKTYVSNLFTFPTYVINGERKALKESLLAVEFRESKSIPSRTVISRNKYSNASAL